MKSMNLSKGEVYRNLYAALPIDRGVMEWTKEECLLVRKLMKPCFNGERGWKSFFNELITERLRQL